MTAILCALFGHKRLEESRSVVSVRDAHEGAIHWNAVAGSTSYIVTGDGRVTANRAVCRRCRIPLPFGAPQDPEYSARVDRWVAESTDAE